MAVVGDRYKVGRGRSIHDNVTGGEMWIINDEDPEAEKETYVTLTTCLEQVLSLHKDNMEAEYMIEPHTVD